jgi:tetratricopeptide (TPR) repeat protein
VTDRLLVDLDTDGQVTVSVLDGAAGGLPQSGGSFPLAWTLDTADAEELRWYLEDYLRAPYGEYQERGERVAARLAEWGQASFGAVFGGSQAARDAYVRSRDRNGVVEVVVRSAVAERLALPWELLRDPARPTPLALDRVRIRRALPTADLANTFQVEGERLRVLMVISRPAGQDDVGYRMVARPLMARLEAVRGAVDLVVLRPPTLDRLREVLAEARAAGTPFQVVHFDGHGAVDGGPRPGWGPMVSLEDSAGQGVLVFERQGGGPDRVPAAQVAAVLSEAEVPVVVLNACQSGALGGDVGAAVATRLLQQGAAAVVAMAYSVYAVAAAEFMTAFYDRLFNGGEIADAVAAGRSRLAQRNRRPSPKGPLPLQDWLVPVLYSRQDVSFPALQRAPAKPDVGASLDAILDQARNRSEDAGLGDPLAPVGEFVGRDGVFYELETAARLQKVVLLHGAAGMGKTELAKAFGRWWRDTGGVDQPTWVIWHSFEPGIASFGLPGVLNTVGSQVFGTDFARLDDGQRRQAVIDLLRKRRLLLIWDNFESVFAMPDPTGATPPLDEAGRQQIADFLTVVGTGQSAVLITSRSREDWLGDDLRRIGVTGLGREEADEYTDALLEPYPRAAARRKDKAFAELMTWLNGHPLSMRLVLPHLDTAEAGNILTDLRTTGSHVMGSDKQGRTQSLAASIAYSYQHLTADEQQALVVLSLFHTATHIAALALISSFEGIPTQFSGRSREAWETLLDRATDLGLLTAIGAGMYLLHPALPAYLTGQWQHQRSNDYTIQCTATESALLDAYAGLADWLKQQVDSGAAELAITIVHIQRHTLGAMLNHALTLAFHEAAYYILAVLNLYWGILGLGAEADGWTDRILHATEYTDGSPPQIDTPAGALWLFTIGEQATRQIKAHQLSAADATYRRLLAMITKQPDSPKNLGYLATTYHQLGTITQDRGDLDSAENWYHQSLTVREQVGNRPGMAVTYHQLGTVAQERGDLDTAENWYQQSLTIKEQLGNRPGMANSYHQLGRVAQDRGDLDTAENWYQQSLTINEQLGNRRGTADIYHQLGRVAQDRGDLDTAENWYQQSLTINEKLDSRPGMANSYGQLGLLAEERGAAIAALAWTIRCATLFDSFPHPATGPAPRHLARLTAALGWDALRQEWQKITGQQLPPEVIEHIKRLHSKGTSA